MNKDEILAKSRAENKNKDVYEQEVLKQASRSAVVVQMSFATLFFVTQIMTGGGINWGLLVLCQEKVQIKYNQFSLFM